MMFDERVTGFDSVGSMLKGNTAPFEENKHLLHRSGLKGRIVVLSLI